jgi:hypothetical protein
MTATAAMISYVSPYVVSDVAGSNLTTAKFNHLSAVAKEQLDGDNPGLSSTAYDQAHALLICHLYFCTTLGLGAYTSERAGDYGYSKGEGQSPFLFEYRRIIETGQASALVSAGVEQERTDHKMSAMKLDELGTPEYGRDEEGTE